MTDLDLPPHVRELIETARVAPVQADRVAIRAKIQATIGSGAAGAAAGGAGKLLMGMAIAVIAVVGAGYVMTRGDSASHVSAETTPARASAPPPAPPTVTAAPAPAATEVITPPVPRVTTPPARVSSPARVASPDPPVAAAEPPRADEAALLADATRALTRGDPERTLALVAEHARRFANGALAEERDALELEALLALGRRAEAADAARRFAGSYSHSVHAPLVERALNSKETPR